METTKNKRLQTSRLEIRLLTYTIEHIITYQLYSLKLNKCFDAIEIYDPPGVSDSTRIDTMLSAIKISSVELRIVITNTHSDNRQLSTFPTASADIVKHISYLFPDIKWSHDH